MADNRASQALREAFSVRGTQSRLAEKTGISQPQLSKLVGGAPANRRDAIELKKALGIEIEWWDEPALSKPRRPKGRAA